MRAYLHRALHAPANVVELPPETTRLPEVVIVGELAYVMRSVSKGDGYYYRATCLRLYEDDPA